MEIFLLCIAAFFAGLIDSIAGGGGLIQVPALFSLFPQALPATLLGTNKLSSLFGTVVASLRYSRAVEITWHVVLPAAIAAFIASFSGAMTVTLISPKVVRPLIPIMLTLVAIYTFMKKDFGSVHAPRYRKKQAMVYAVLWGMALGFYEGFFGPGAGSLMMFVFIQFFGFNFLSASITAKMMNATTNAAALLWFGLSGNVWWKTGLAMAACNVAGSLIGSSLAIAKGSQFVRRLFLLVVSVLILKLTYDQFFHH